MSFPKCSYLGEVASNIKRFAEDAIQKEAFIETFKERHTLAFVVEGEQDEDSAHRSSYAWTSNNGGILTIHIPKDRFCSNVSCAGDDLSKTCSGDSPLSVATRKNIQESQKALQKHLKTIKTATGVDFETEIDWVPFAAIAEERGYTDRAGEMMHESYVSALADNIKRFCEDPIQKEAFLETFKERHVIAFVLEPVQDDESTHRSSYAWTSNNSGVLTVHLPKDRWCSNVSCAGDDLTKTCSGDSPLSVATRKNIQDSQKVLQKHLKTIKTATGIDFEVEIDWVVMAAIAEERGYTDRAGEMMHEAYVSSLADNIKRFCEDAIQKEAFVESFKERHAITFILEEVQDDESPHRSSYAWTSNNSGVLTVHLPKDRWCSNVSCAGDDLSKTCSGDSPLSVATRKNIQDQEAGRKKLMTRLNKATGLDFELEIDWVVFAENAKTRGYEDRAGEIVYGWYLGALVDNLESLCKDSMSKEAFTEAVEKKVIAFTIEEDTDKLESSSSYCETKFNDGTLVVVIPKDRLCSNVSECGRDIESHL